MRRILAIAIVVACHRTGSNLPLVDGGPYDGASDGVSGDGGTRFACMTTTCAVGHEFCFEYLAGIAPNACNALPPVCLSTPTCACVVPTLGTACPPGALTCTEDHGAVTAVCSLP